MPGEYWCQAMITNSSGQYLTIESNVLTVLRPENYTGLSVCTSVQSIDLETCAVILSSSSPSQPEVAPSSCLMSEQVKNSALYFTGSVVETTRLQTVPFINEPG